MASPRPSYLPEMTTIIGQTLQFVDAWSALSAESATWQANGIAVAQSDVDALNIPGLTVADVQAARSTMQALADWVHLPANSAKLYRMKS